MNRIVRLLPGLGVAAAATAIAWPVSMVAPILSPLLIAIVLGIIVGNVLPELPQIFRPGLDFAAKPLLRLGIVALGAQVVLGDILDLGWLVLVLAAVVVAVGIVSGLLLARPFRVDSNLALLIGCGFGICGAAAVAGIESTLKAKKEDVAAAIGLVVLFGTLMIAVIPSLSVAFGLAQDTAGMWGGASTHEVAQVVAIGGIIGPAALQVAVLVKLSRVIMLAPTVAVLSMVMRRKESRERAAMASSAAMSRDEASSHSPAEAAPQSSSTSSPTAGSSSTRVQSTAGSSAPATKRPPIVPLFVLGFLLMAGLRTFGLLPDFAVSGLGWIQTVCLAMAMFALGRGVQWRSLRNLGAGPIGLAATTTLIVAVIGLGGALLLT
ncbi:putative sulfate exporter family transporter [Brevibacterium sp. RIT 803]|uniref:YeiH family protein n=1 Tax=Brevibacterium sp. RIT 803 TaxID=2810210 RepID=UPI001950B45C|nr:putative sulfate exporter family transporter [Brevibacterium sp. RIT 803]MBM6589285.1 putative sulfate exporter family transporter [Brevibacterium sp. RIT 803]